MSDWSIIDCEAAQQQLFALRDGALEPATADAVRAHLAGCSRCRAASAFDDRLRELLRGDLPQPSNVFAASIVERTHKRRRTNALVYATAASVLILGILSVWRPWTRLVDYQTIVELPGKSPARSDDLGELAQLFAPPPVDSLDVLSRQQNGYVVALRRLGEE